MIRIGILTYFASINYGAFFQAYALQECLKSRYGDAVDIEMINYETRSAHELYLRRVLNMDCLFRNKLIIQYDRFLESREKLNLSEESLITDNIRQVERFLQDKYDIIIAGSDEIWKTDSFIGFPTAYWLNFDLEKTTYMAYAVSGRNDYQRLTKKMQKYIATSMKRFFYVGTRDEVTKMELQKIVDQEIDRNCDPVFLMPELFRINDREKVRRKYREKFGLMIDRPLISLMLTQNKEIGGRLFRMAGHDNLIIGLYEPIGEMRVCNLTELSPFEWCEIIGISDLVITDFFHGTAFSLLHGIPFVALEYAEKGRGKIENLLQENFMEDKFLYLSDYKNNDIKLAADIYIKGRKEMRDYKDSCSREALLREAQKSQHFFETLEKVIENKKID